MIKIELIETQALDFILNLNKVICWLDGFTYEQSHNIDHLKLDQLKNSFDEIFKQFNDQLLIK